MQWRVALRLVHTERNRGNAAAAAQRGILPLSSLPGVPVEENADVAGAVLPGIAENRRGIPVVALAVSHPDGAQLPAGRAWGAADADECSISATERPERVCAGAGLDPHDGSDARQ